ncbi:hypothetical protein ENSA7_56100 [Enhygromyxa salina]|uniref:Uncharacterized protein n=1 Tax=Enhygromyxa salina TaxID=215803 RepID=A0A2S9YAA8_9BACT|nr:hypothetical protein ENSA7_56100 [Enhygromyxa salina]
MSKYTPDLTCSEFDELSGELKRRLREDWYDRRPPRPPRPDSSTSGPFAGLPDIDSKEVVRANSIFREVLGVRFNPKFIRKGGYRSFAHFFNHSCKMLRGACLPNPPTAAMSSVSESARVH